MKLARRHLLSAALALPLAPLPVFAAQAGRARIRSVEAFAVPRACYVKVTADDGTAGWGEAGHSGSRLVARLIRDELARLVVGDDVFAGDSTWAKMYYEVDELGPGGLASQAIAGVDCAIWDLRGRLLNQPVWALLGGRFRSKIPLYGSFSRYVRPGVYLTPREAAARAAQLVEEMGVSAIKVRMAIREENVNPDPDPTFETAAAVRRAIGDKVALYVDPNNGYRPARAIEVGRRLQGELGVTVYEEPVAMYHYASMARVVDALDMEVAAGEHEYTPWMFRDLIEQGRPDVLNPDVSKLSGLTAGRRVIALADAFDKSISVHNARPTLLTAAHVHYVAGAIMANRPQEHPGLTRLAELWRFFQNRMVPKDGMLDVPDTPGLGLEPDEAAIRAAAA
jgi:L-alanine-DL-glutamate epimerase-like enolase superfamily enzyme